MMGLDDFLIGIITNGIVAWLADKDAKIEDAQRRRLDEIIARIERSRTSPDKLRGLAAQSLRDACAKSPGLQRAADAIMSDPVLARDLTLWLLEPDPAKFDGERGKVAAMLCNRFECERSAVDGLLSSLEQGVNADLQLGQLRGHNEHRLILETLQGQKDWQVRIERDNAYMVAMLERLLAATALHGARPLRPQPRPWRRNNKLLSGSKPRIEDIEEGLDFRRTIHEKVMTAIRSAEPPALFAFLGDQQMGKTTFLLRIGIELALEGYPVLEPNSSHGGEPYADWVIKHAGAFHDKRPLILLIDDPRLDSENFTRQMTALYDRKARIIVLTAENLSDWNRANLDQNPLFESAHRFGVGNAEGEAIAAVEHLERTGAIQIASERRERLLQDVRQIEGGPGFFERVIGVASGDKYKSMSRIVRNRLDEAGDSADAKAFEKLYTFISVSGSVGLALPEDVAKAVLSEADLNRAMAFNKDISDPPVLLDEGSFAFSHERHGHQFLAEHPDGEAQAREDALRAIVGAGADHPAFTPFIGLLLEAHRKRGLVETALMVWDEFGDEFSETHWIACNRSNVVHTWNSFLYKVNRASAALPVMYRALEINPRDPNLHNSYAVLLATVGETKKARNHYEQALEFNPRETKAHNNYAAFLDSLGETDKARKHYEQALEINPRYAIAHLKFADLLESLGETDKARRHYDQALEIDPRSAEANHYYASFLQSVEETTKARIHYERALEIAPRYSEAHNNYAVHLLSLGETDKARSHLEQALEFNPRLAQVHKNYAILLHSLGETDKARGHYEHALEIDPGDAVTRYNYAILLEEFSEPEKAREHREEAFEIDPSLRVEFDKQDESTPNADGDAEDK
ncbi:MAG: tetratricopeptide repeat protein [Planctomycetes bacterium]|nr:tetratricopeptide repeat protein [Planctomycetota bacterium]